MSPCNNTITRLPSLKAVLFIFLFALLQTSCNTNELPKRETGSVTDVQGNVYKTVKIGDQWWMAEDLKTTRYRNGDSIAVIGSDSLQWVSNTEGALTAYGAFTLYNHYAVTNPRGLAPIGWHIATDEDWKQLELTLNMSAAETEKLSFRGTNEGDKLKATGIDNWSLFEGVWGTDEVGFKALATNCRLFDSRLGQPVGNSYSGFWWTATLHSSGTTAYYRHLYYKNSGIFRHHGMLTYGFAVRCVKD